MHPYEMANDEGAHPQAYQVKYDYYSPMAAPKREAYEMSVSGGAGLAREEKRCDAPMKMDAHEQRSLRNPAPMYGEAMVLVELDGTSRLGSRYGRQEL